MHQKFQWNRSMAKQNDVSPLSIIVGWLSGSFSLQKMSSTCLRSFFCNFTNSDGHQNPSGHFEILLSGHHLAIEVYFFNLFNRFDFGSRSKKWLRKERAKSYFAEKRRGQIRQNFRWSKFLMTGDCW